MVVSDFLGFFKVSLEERKIRREVFFSGSRMASLEATALPELGSGSGLASGSLRRRVTVP